MKIAMADNTGLKFCGDLKKHWEDMGHEVRYEPGSSEYLAQWADVYYVEWIDGNLDYLWKIYNGAEGVSRTPDWDNSKKPKMICRMIDWDIWCEYVPYYNQQYIDFIDTVVCIAPHIKERIESKANYGDKLHLVRPGVDLNKFTLKTKETDGFQLGMVLGDMWWPKNHMGGLDIFTSLYREDSRWRLHIRGQHEGGQYWPKMYEYYLESRGIKDVVTLYPSVPDMNEWYENIDVLLHPGMKEAFSYATAEAMCKGIPAVVNDFYGSHDIWGYGTGVYLYQTHQQAIKHIEILSTRNDNTKKTMGNELRKLIEENYSNERFFKEMDALL